MCRLPARRLHAAKNPQPWQYLQLITHPNPHPGIHLAAYQPLQLPPAPPPSSSQASGYTGDPLALSYWAASNLPLGPSTRQQLLAAPHAAARLRLLLLVLGELGALCCRRCGAGLAAAGDTLKLSPEGIGGTFVNSAG